MRLARIRSDLGWETIVDIDRRQVVGSNHSVSLDEIVEFEVDVNVEEHLENPEVFDGHESFDQLVALGFIPDEPVGDKTNGDAYYYLNAEGVGYAVQDYIGGDEFKDPETRALWKTASDALDALVAHITSETGREMGEI